MTVAGVGAAVGAERVRRIQEALREDGVPAWLLFDFHGSNPISRKVAGMVSGPDGPKTTRRWFYLVPAQGEPVKIVHRIEPSSLDHLPGEALVYLRWQELRDALAKAVASVPGPDRVVAMEYSPDAALPYLSRVDAGTVEMVRAAGAGVVSSADLAQRFDGTLAPEAREDHKRTGLVLNGIMAAAFARVRDRVRAGAPLTEVSLQAWILEQFQAEGLVADDPPAVAVNDHAGDPHFTTRAEHDRPLRRGDLLMIDAWCRRPAPGSVYADYTQVAMVDSTVPEKQAEIFAVVRDARDAAIETVRRALRADTSIRGCDVDDAARGVIQARGYGDRFLHRTGHSIGEEVHANGVHLDNLETRDERRLIDGTLVSVEPGIYLPEFGIRSEVNLLIDRGDAIVTAEPYQRELPALLA
ncbi:MAG TPA: M24 family metallopeptidase [Candidatus Eisenbacteria bacterium]|nr:M24 family metallopeptidase [Candidatus Eisenbacteria bacterium]